MGNVRTVVVVRDPATFSGPTADAFQRCFSERGWKVKVTTEKIRDKPDLVAGWGFRDVIHEAWDRWPDLVLHVDAGFWSRSDYMKLALGGRWSPITGRDYPPARFSRQHVSVHPGRSPGNRILVCGMSAKAAISWGLKPETWEREAVDRLRDAGATVVYRPKPTWPDARPIKGATYDRMGPINSILSQVSGVVSHHSNGAIDGLAFGIPVYVEVGIAKSLSVARIEDVVEANAPNMETRMRFLREVAWHQWTFKELAAGDWLHPPAPLSSNSLFERS